MTEQSNHPDRTLRAFAGRKGVTRRDFMERAVASGLTVAAATAMWSESARAEQVRGGHIVTAAGDGQSADSFIIGHAGNSHQTTLTETFRSKLVDARNDGGLDPMLATEWNASDGGATWTFKLRQGVEFHNGKSLDAQDVIDSMNVHRGPDSPSGGASMMATVADIRSDGDDVIFELSEPAADFPYYLAQYLFQVGPSVDGEVDMSGMGTGAYVMQDYEPGVRGTGERFANYFLEDQGFFDSFEHLSVKDHAALSSALASDSVQAVWPVEPKTADLLAQNQGVNILSVAGGSTITMPMRADTPPFDNLDFRLAMKYLVDREQMRDVIFSGHASLANDHPVAPFDQFFNPAIPQREFDPDKARHHLEKAGYGGETIQIHASAAAFSGAVDAGVLYAENAKQAGFNLEVVREPVDGYWADVWGTVPFSYCYWNARPTPDLMLTLAYICDAAWADTYWCDREFTDLVVAARTELDTEKRKLLYADVQLILHERGSTIVPLFQNLVHGARDRIDTGGEVLGATPFDSFRMFRKWSFKEGMA